MAREETTTRTLYKFDELSDDAKAKAIEANRDWNVDDSSWYEFTYDDAERMGEMLGITIDQEACKTMGGSTVYKPSIQFSGFWSQGDGASFTGRYEYKPGAVKALIDETGGSEHELIRIARELQALQRPFFYGLTAKIEMGHYGGSCVHSGCMVVDTTHKWDDYYNGRDNNPLADVPLPDDEIKQLMRDFADWIYKSLEAEYDHLTSDEVIAESLVNNEVEFEEDGDLA
jgi:hypothetical protein